MRRTVRWSALLLVLGLLATPVPAQHPVNVLQDCWTTGPEPTGGLNPEGENYSFPPDVPITFVWKHKLMDEPCINYVASIYGFDCLAGKPVPSRIAWSFPNLAFGEILPDPDNPEQLLTFTAPLGSIPPGVWDWALLVECNDSGNGIAIGPDGDVEDECGVNVGTQPIVVGPVILGPEPVEFFDPHPGGTPAGRGAGEEGTTRPWCFEVQPDGPSLVTCQCKNGSDVPFCIDLDCADQGARDSLCLEACLGQGGQGGNSCIPADPSCLSTEGGSD